MGGEAPGASTNWRTDRPPSSALGLRTGQATESATSRTPSGIEAKREQVLLALGIVLHLSRLGRPGPDDLPRPESTQQGIAATLDVTQGGVSKILERLAAVDVVRYETSHVRGRVRRVRVYFLTASGELLAKRYRERHGDELPAL